MAFIQLGAPSNFGSETSPMIGLIFAYEKKRSGADMQYRFRITVKAVSGSSYFGYNIVCTPTIAGSKKTAITLKANSPSQWTSNIVYTSSWYTVKNKTTGTTAISFAMSSNASGRSQTFSYNMAIDPAASSFSVDNGTLGSAQNITVTKNNSAFTSTITYKCGSASGTIADKSTDTIIPWTPPINLANQNTTGISLSCVLTFTTYSGSSVVGTSSKTIILAIPSSIVPTVSLSVTDGTNNLTQFGAYVQGKSTIKVSILASGAEGSSISKYSTSANGGTYTSADFTTDVITGSGTLTISVTVTDSRGRKASTSKEITVLAYERPKVSALSVIRCNQSGMADSNGVYLKATFSAKITPLNSKNTKTYQLQYKKKSESSYTTVTLSSYTDAYSVTNGTHIFAAETNSSYDVILKASDYFTSASLLVVGPAISKIWSIFKKGLGFAIGKIAELANTFEVGWKSIFYSDVEVKGNIIGQLKRGGNSSSWGNGRNSVIFRQNTVNGYSPFASIKTTNGSWEIGAYDSDSFLDHLIFSYVKDSDFNAGSNVAKIVSIKPDGSFSGKIDKANYLIDRTNGTASYLNYGASAITTCSYLAAWNGYELRAITPTTVRTVIGAAASSHTHNYAANGRRVVSLWSGSVAKGGTLTLSETSSNFNFLIIIDGTSSGAYATPIICPLGHGSTTLRGMGGYEKSSGIEEHNIAGSVNGTSVTIDQIGSRTYTSSGIQAYQYLYVKRIYGVR